MEMATLERAYRPLSLYLEEDHVGERLRQLRQERGDALAGAAPGGVEVDHHLYPTISIFPSSVICRISSSTHHSASTKNSHNSSSSGKRGWCRASAWFRLRINQSIRSMVPRYACEHSTRVCATCVFALLLLNDRKPIDHVWSRCARNDVHVYFLFGARSVQRSQNHSSRERRGGDRSPRSKQSKNVCNFSSRI